MKRAKVALAAALCAVSLSSLPAAYAQNLLDTVGDILNFSGDVAGAAAGTTLNAAGSAADLGLNAAGAVLSLPAGMTEQQLLVQLDARNRDLDAYIAQGLASGRLTEAQALDMRRELDRLAADLTAARAAGLTQADMIRIASGYDMFGNRLVSMVQVQPTFQPILIHNNSMAAVVGGTTGSTIVGTTGTAAIAGGCPTVIKKGPATVVSQRVIPATVTTSSLDVVSSDLNVRKRELAGRIADAVNCGRLSAGQASVLMAALNKIDAAHVGMSSDGYINYVESRVLYKAMDKIGREYDDYIDREDRPAIVLKNLTRPM